MRRRKKNQRSKRKKTRKREIRIRNIVATVTAAAVVNIKVKAADLTTADKVEAVLMADSPPTWTTTTETTTTIITLVVDTAVVDVNPITMIIVMTATIVQTIADMAITLQVTHKMTMMIPKNNTVIIITIRTIITIHHPCMTITINLIIEVTKEEDAKDDLR